MEKGEDILASPHSIPSNFYKGLTRQTMMPTVVFMIQELRQNLNDSLNHIRFQ